MKRANAAVEGEGISVRRASELYHVPRSTLHERISGRVKHGVKPGPSALLTLEEEEELVGFLIKCARIGYPHTRKQVMALVQSIARGKGIETTVSEGWWEHFRQRHSGVSLRIAAALSVARLMASDMDSLNNYFDLLGKPMKFLIVLPTYLTVMRRGCLSLQRH